MRKTILNWYIQRNKWRSCHFADNMTFSIFSYIKSWYKNAPFLCLNTYFYYTLVLNIDVKHASIYTTRYKKSLSVFRYNMTFLLLSYIKFYYKAPNFEFHFFLNIDTNHPSTWICLTFWHSYAIVRPTSCWNNAYMANWNYYYSETRNDRLHLYYLYNDYQNYTWPWRTHILMFPL